MNFGLRIGLSFGFPFNIPRCPLTHSNRPLPNTGRCRREYGPAFLERLTLTSSSVMAPPLPTIVTGNLSISLVELSGREPETSSWHLKYSINWIMISGRMIYHSRLDAREVQRVK